MDTRHRSKKVLETLASPNLKVSFSLHSVPSLLARTTNTAKKTLEREKKMGSPDEHQPTNSGDITPRVRRGRCLLTTVGRKVMLYVGFYPNFEDYPAPNGGLAAWRDLWSTYLRWLSSQFRNSSVGPLIHPPTKEEAKVSDGDQEKARDRTNYMLPKCVWPGFRAQMILLVFNSITMSCGT